MRQRGLSNERATPDFQTSTVRSANQIDACSLSIFDFSYFHKLHVPGHSLQQVCEESHQKVPRGEVVSLAEVNFLHFAFSQVGQGVMSIPNKEMGLVGILSENI